MTIIVFGMYVLKRWGLWVLGYVEYLILCTYQHSISLVGSVVLVNKCGLNLPPRLNSSYPLDITELGAGKRCGYWLMKASMSRLQHTTAQMSVPLTLPYQVLDFVTFKL